MDMAVTVGIVAGAGLLAMVILGFIVVSCCLRRGNYQEPALEHLNSSMEGRG